MVFWEATRIACMLINFVYYNHFHIVILFGLSSQIFGISESSLEYKT